MAQADVNKLLNLLGLARRSGRLAVGFRAVETMVRRGERPLVIVAKDIGAAQKSRVLRWQPVAGFVTDVLMGEEMAQRLGRDKLVVVGVSDSGFIAGIAKLDL